MHNNIPELSESTSQSSPITSTDTGSNWSRPVKNNKPKWRVASVPRRTTRSATAKSFANRNRLENNSFSSNGPSLKLSRYCLKMRKPPNLSIKQTRAMIEKINDQSRLVYYLWPRYQQQNIELEAEVAGLQQRLHELQVEEVEIKRKRWCRVCEEEATYVHAKRFFCSKDCQQQCDE